MTPVRKYIQAEVTSGALRAEVHPHAERPSLKEGEPPHPAVVMVELNVTGTPILTTESLKLFTEEVGRVAEEEARKLGGRLPDGA